MLPTGTFSTASCLRPMHSTVRCTVCGLPGSGWSGYGQTCQLFQHVKTAGGISAAFSCTEKRTEQSGTDGHTSKQ